MKSKQIGIFFFIILLVLVYVFNRGDVTFTSQDNVMLRPISSMGFELTSNINLYNPNVLSCTIKSIHERFRINGVVMGILDQEINQGIPGRKESSFPVSIRFTREDYNRAVSSDISNIGKANIEVEGEIVFTTVFSGGKIQLHQSLKDSSATGVQ